VPVLPDISGLIAWSERAEWRGALGDLVMRHGGQAYAGAGIEMADLTHVLDDYAGSVLWGAAFEDLLSTDLPDGRNIADDYLRRRGWKESVATREYIGGLRRSVISLYEVSGIVPGESMLLRDLVSGGEPVRVTEKRGSESLHQWDRIATRVIPLRHRAVISGTLMAFDQQSGDALLASLRKIRTKAPRTVTAVAQELGLETDAKALAGMLTPNLLLARAAFMFTNTWLSAALKAAQGLERPTLVNSDGDPLEFTGLHYPLLAGVTPERVRQAIAAVPSLRPESPNFWNWLAPHGTKRPPPLRWPQGHTLITTMDDGALVLGTLTLKGRRLSLEANSVERAKRGQVLLASALSGLVGPPLTEHTDLEQMLNAEEPPPEPSGLTPEQERRFVHQSLDDHYHRILHEPIPVLGGKSPRAAAKTAKGQEKVVAWLKSLENHMARLEPGDPMGGYDLNWLWQELGVESLRH